MLAGIVVLVVLTLLIQAAAADGRIGLARIASRKFRASLFPNVRHFGLDLTCIGNVGLSFQRAQLLFVGLLALQLPMPRFWRALVRWPASPAVRLLDTALRIGVVRDVAFDGVFTPDVFQIVQCRLPHRDALGAADQRIAIEINVARF